MTSYSSFVDDTNLTSLYGWLEGGWVYSYTSSSGSNTQLFQTFGSTSTSSASGTFTTFGETTYSASYDNIGGFTSFSSGFVTQSTTVAGFGSTSATFSGTGSHSDTTKPAATASGITTYIGTTSHNTNQVSFGEQEVVDDLIITDYVTTIIGFGFTGGHSTSVIFTHSTTTVDYPALEAGGMVVDSRYGTKTYSANGAYIYEVSNTTNIVRGPKDWPANTVILLTPEEVVWLGTSTGGDAVDIQVLDEAGDTFTENFTVYFSDLWINQDSSFYGPLNFPRLPVVSITGTETSFVNAFNNSTVTLTIEGVHQGSAVTDAVTTTTIAKQSNYLDHSVSGTYTSGVFAFHGAPTTLYTTSTITTNSTLMIDGIPIAAGLFSVVTYRTESINIFSAATTDLASFLAQHTDTSSSYSSSTSASGAGGSGITAGGDFVTSSIEQFFGIWPLELSMGIISSGDPGLAIPVNAQGFGQFHTAGETDQVGRNLTVAGANSFYFGERLLLNQPDISGIFVLDDTYNIQVDGVPGKVNVTRSPYLEHDWETTLVVSFTSGFGSTAIPSTRTIRFGLDHFSMVSNMTGVTDFFISNGYYASYAPMGGIQSVNSLNATIWKDRSGVFGITQCNSNTSFSWSTTRFFEETSLLPTDALIREKGISAVRTPRYDDFTTSFALGGIPYLTTLNRFGQVYSVQDPAQST